MKHREHYWEEKIIELEIRLGGAQKEHVLDGLPSPRSIRNADKGQGIGREISMLGAGSTEWWKLDELPEPMKDYLQVSFV
jgi:hypothetical protein